MNGRFAVVFGACLTQFTIIGLLFSYGIFIKAFETEFGWSRTLLSGCSTLAFFMMGLLAMVSGRLSDRFGPRRVLAVTGISYGLGYVLMSQISAPWQLYLIFATFLGLGLGSHDVVTLSTIGRWFSARRGIMTGLVKVGTATGQIIVPPLAALLIAGFGWRMALMTLGVAAAVLLFIAAMAMRSPPVAASTDPLAPPQGMAFASARRTRAFWTLGATQFLLMPSLFTVPLHVAVHGMDIGMSAPLAATLLSAIGVASIAGRLLVGGLIDRIGGRNGYICCFAALILGLCILILGHSHIALFAAMAVYGFGHGGFFTVVSPTVAEFFGLRAHGAIFGTVLFFGTVGGSLGPILAGLVFDTTGSYFIAFSGLLVMAALGLGLVLSLPTPDPEAVPASV
ncbi:MFS transporter [Sedimentitalea todarodis]|uniref:MFS transporter n=1 Tax=Sedimentitalea todarodis TaxID=1631240 RepID=A0ABU3V8V3_9RHOB|nr:MFS transporter [Sedimentitalea todarodis]MDU9002602.1 MFS transporter [Sedimentitalea todarodis]